MANPIFFPTLYAPKLAAQGANALGFVYIGEVDQDPTVLGNRVSVTLREEDGTEVVLPPASQPLQLSAGGVFIYNGSPVMVLVDGAYSMTIQDSSAVQLYYFPEVPGAFGSTGAELTPAGGAPACTPGRGFGVVYTDTVSGVIELFYQDSDCNDIQLTSGGQLILPETYPFPVQSPAPSALADNMIVYSKVANGNLELFARDPNGNEIQITNDGQVNAGEGSVTEISGTSTTITSANNGQILVFDTASLVEITLPEQATTELSASFYFLAKNAGGGAIRYLLEGSDTLNGISLQSRPEEATTIFLENAGSPNTWSSIGNEWNPSQVVSASLTAPPGATPDLGAAYIVGAGATGDWAGQDNNFAIHVGSDEYEFVSPDESTQVVYDLDAGEFLGWTGSGWGAIAPSAVAGAVNIQAGTTYTATAADAGATIIFNSASDCTLTLPENATEALSAGFNVKTINRGTGALYLAFEGSDTHEGVRWVQNPQEPVDVQLRVAGSPNEWSIYNNVIDTSNPLDWTGTAPPGAPPADGAVYYINGTGTGNWAGQTRQWAIHIGSGVYDFQAPIVRYQVFYNPVNTNIETLDTQTGTVTAAN